MPDVTGIERQFDYLIPTAWESDGRAERVAVGSMVRVSLNGRRVNAWVTNADVTLTAVPKKPLAELTKLRGVGPSAAMIDLAKWAAWRWAGRTPHLLSLIHI